MSAIQLARAFGALAVYAVDLDAGRLALLERGDDEFGPYQSPMEDGMQHFHEWYRREMGATKTTQSI
jgi:choline monooxygenase